MITTIIIVSAITVHLLQILSMVVFKADPIALLLAFQLENFKSGCTFCAGEFCGIAGSCGFIAYSLAGAFFFGAKLNVKANAAVFTNTQNPMSINKNKTFIRILLLWLGIAFIVSGALFSVFPHVIPHILPMALSMFFPV